MWYVKTFLIILFVIVVILFGLANRGQTVTLRWWSFGGEGTSLDVVVALFAAFGLGALVFFFVSVFRELRLRRQLSRLEREGERLRRELNALRTAPLEGPLAPPREGRAADEQTADRRSGATDDAES